MGGNKDGARKRIEQKLAEDPDYFKKIARKRTAAILAKNPNYYKEQAKKLTEKDPDHFSRIGSMGKKGGKNSTGSFTAETAKEAGRKSRRPKAKKFSRKVQNMVRGNSTEQGGRTWKR